MSSGDKLIAAVFRGGGIGYDTVRSLQNHNIETYLLTAKNLKDGKYPGAKMLLCPSHLTPEGAEELVSFINTNIAPGRKVVLIPTSDDSALFLAQKRSQLDGRFLYLTPDASLVEAMDNKMLFYELCRKRGLSYPETWIVRNESELDSVMDKVTIPSIVKPFRSREWTESIGYKVGIVKSLKELRSVALNTLSYGCEVIIQDMIPGGPENIVFMGGLYDQKSNPVKLYVGRKYLQFPLNVGTTCFAALSWNQDVVDLSNAFIKAIGYTGLIDIEFIYDRLDKTYKVIEVNPRNGLWHRISDDGHWDITSFYVNWINGIKDAAKDYKAHEDGRKWIYPHEHLCSRIEANGLVKGTGLWFVDMCKTKLRCAWDVGDLHRDWRYARIVLGYIRRLGLRTLVFGKNSTSSTKRAS